jgi:hypothetical protein
MQNELLSKIVDLIHAVRPNECVVVPPSTQQPELVIYGHEMQATISDTQPASYLVLNRTTGEPVIWGEADCTNDALAVVLELLSVSVGD